MKLVADYLQIYGGPVNTLRDKSGFGSALTLTFLGLFSVILILAAFVRFTVDARSDFRYFCFNNLQMVQKTLLDHESRLIALNPIAQALRLKLKILYVQLAAAVASENAPLIIQISQWITQTKEQQRLLHLQQKTLINFGQSYAQIQLLKSFNDFSIKNRGRSSAWSAILNIQDSIIINSFRPVMAVFPDSSADIAPVYQFDPDFENKQRITAFWKLWFFAKPSFQTLVKTNQMWSLKCDSEPQNQQTLKPLVKADRL